MAEGVAVLRWGGRRCCARIRPRSKAVKKPFPVTCGDVIIRYELLREARERQTRTNLITDDVKEDWWLRIDGKTIGPLPELREEFSNRTTGSAFHMYTSDLFMELAAKFLNRPVPTEAIKEVKEAQVVREAYRKPG